LELSNSNYARIKKYNILLIALIISILPKIFYLRLVILSRDNQLIWGNLIDSNFSAFYKMNFLLFATFLLLISIIPYLIQIKIKKTFYYIPLIFLAILIIISAYFSKYSTVTMTGFPGRYESLFVLLSYLLLTLVAFNTIEQKDAFKFVFSIFFISIFILGVHGVLQYFGFDFFATDIGRRIITPQGLERMVDNLSFLDSNRVYSTLGNPNYVGSYGAMVVSLLFGLYINTRKQKRIYILGFLNILMFAYLVGSRSRGGMIGLLAGLILLLVLLAREIRENWKQVAIVLLAFFLIFLSMDVYSVQDLFGDIISPQPEEKLVEEEIIAPPITGVESKDNQLKLVTADSEVTVEYRNNSFEFFGDEQNKLFNYRVPFSDKIFISGKEYINHSFYLEQDNKELIWQYDNKEAQFKFSEEQFLMQGINGEYFAIKEVPSFGFEGYERLGSSRGYIWSRTLPMLRETLLLGHGPDTYAFYFPQHDVVGKLRFLRSPEILVDKPHNMYLQTAVNTGVLSLLVLLGMWGYYILQSLKLYWQADYSRWENRVGVALMASVVAYLVTGVFNDSVVSVAPVFWTLLGMGISVNLLLKEKN